MKELSCMIGITLLITSLSMTLIKKDQNEFKNFYNLLNQKQQNIYEKIIQERLSIYFMGMILGLGLASIFRKSCEKRNCLIFRFF